MALVEKFTVSTCVLVGGLFDTPKIRVVTSEWFLASFGDNFVCQTAKGQLDTAQLFVNPADVTWRVGSHPGFAPTL